LKGKPLFIIRLILCLRFCTNAENKNEKEIFHHIFPFFWENQIFPDFPRFSADLKNYRFGWRDNDESILSILSFIQLK
jgi:hypothetical protein